MCRCANSSLRVPYRLLAIALAFAAIVASGCGGKGPKNSVTGKVTLNGRPVKGRLIFIGSDGKERDAGIGAGGEYFLPDPPIGEVTILVKGPEVASGGSAEKPPSIPMPTPKEKTKGEMPTSSGTSQDDAVNPPAKYGKKDTSPLKKTIKGGTKEQLDLPLEK